MQAHIKQPVENSTIRATEDHRSELAREAQRLGYGIKVAGRDGRWELKGYTREQVMVFSPGHQDIEQTSPVKAWRVSRLRRSSRIERGSPRIIATKTVLRRNGAHAHCSMESKSSVYCNRATAAPSSFDIRNRQKKPFARVSTKRVPAVRMSAEEFDRELAQRSNVTALHDRLRRRPIIIFARIGRLSLLRDVTGSLPIPDAVYDEIVIKKAGIPGATDVAQAAWVQKASFANRSIIDGLPSDLHEGGREAMLLPRNKVRHS